MTKKRRQWLWLLMIPLLLLLWWAAGRRSSRPVEKTLPSSANLRPIEKPNLSRSSPSGKPGPAYVISAGAALEEYDQGLEYRLAGRITSEKGDILPGAKVAAYSSGPKKPKFAWPDPVAFDISDHEGQYTIRLSSPMNDAVVGVHKDGFATIEDLQRITVPGTVIKSYRMKPAPACLDGMVTNESGAPVAGASLFTSVDQRSFGGELDLSHLAVFATTDRAGKFTFHGLPEERVHVYIIAAKHLRESRTIELQAGPCGRADFKLRIANTITFRVTDRKGYCYGDIIAQFPSTKDRK